MGVRILSAAPIKMRSLREVQKIVEARSPCHPAEHELVEGWLAEIKAAYEKSKLYLLIHESVDVGHAVNCAAHASLQMYLRHRDAPHVEEWATYSFRKVSCKVTDKEFQRAKSFPDYEIVTEEHLAQQEVALIFLPRLEWPKFFNHLKLYK